MTKHFLKHTCMSQLIALPQSNLKPSRGASRFALLGTQKGALSIPPPTHLPMLKHGPPHVPPLSGPCPRPPVPCVPAWKGCALVSPAGGWLTKEQLLLPSLRPLPPGLRHTRTALGADP